MTVSEIYEHIKTYLEDEEDEEEILLDYDDYALIADILFNYINRKEN